MKNHYKAIAQDIWAGRKDGEDRDSWRWHQAVECVDVLNNEIPSLKENEKGTAIIGFCSDEGVRRNKGRTGAAQGPEAIRKASSSFPVHFSEVSKLIDLGDIVCQGSDLEGAQKALGELIALALENGYRPLVLGGGHEIAYGHYLGIKSYLQKHKPEASLGIINYDAHFDLREIDPEVGPSSGTPFLQIAQDQKTLGKDFNYFVIGINKNSNTKKLFNTAEELGVDFIRRRHVNAEKQVDLFHKIGEMVDKVDYIYLTTCMDVFNAGYAPGVSAPAAQGITPDYVFMKSYKKILKSGKLLSADIAEVNPQLDIDSHTAKLAASLAFEVVTSAE
ncbi:formimidoylglutamase [Sediminitomix flava]|uniref:Formimidoylglutamase n=1 Tax=Sediminitomix flava TaxID=379075 RepID=A0A315ZJ36_SEDFL|nr:formimidoylglutamase [Sediminitomix flava]PWJ44848.1 formiminoglutamase [Sediminitomix flava]